VLVRSGIHSAINGKIRPGECTRTPDRRRNATNAATSSTMPIAVERRGGLSGATAQPPRRPDYQIGCVDSDPDWTLLNRDTPAPVPLSTMPE